MIQNLQIEGGAAMGRRVLAVVAGERSRAQEVAECFAAQGDEVKALWFPDTRRLLEAGARLSYDAVILFSSVDEQEEHAVRNALRGAPLYRL